MFSRIAKVGIIILCVLLYVYTNWHFYLIYIIAISIVTFIFYALDKGQAIRSGRRVPETVLHALVLLGGFPGGWLSREGLVYCARGAQARQP